MKLSLQLTPRNIISIFTYYYFTLFRLYSEGIRRVILKNSRETTARFPGILQIRQRNDAEGLYLSRSTNKIICGLFVRTHMPLNKGVRILTAVTLPKVEEPIFADCEVVGIKNNGNEKPAEMAVKFVSIAAKDRKLLDIFFRNRPNTRRREGDTALKKHFTGHQAPLAQTEQA